jgi:hypothetical protein
VSRRRLASLVAAWVIPTFALFTVAIGLAGWLHYGYRFDNALYRTIALFAIANEIYRVAPGTTDWHFLVGRWTGLLAIFGAALFTVGAVIHERAVVALAQLFGHEIVVAGASEHAGKGYEAARAAGKSVVWIGAPGVEAASLRSIALTWPLEDHLRTISGYAGTADHILVAQQNDAEALTLARVARKSAPAAFITVLLRDARLAEDAAEMFSQSRTRVLSVGTLSARALHVDHPPFLVAQDAGHPRIHALIVGFGQTGQAIARDIIINCRTTFLGLPQITVIDPAAAALEGVMRVRSPELDACASFTFIPGSLGTHGVEPGIAELTQRIAAAGPVTVAYVCRDEDSEALGAAGVVRSLLRGGDIGQPPIFVRLSEDDAVAQFGPGPRRGLNDLIPFGDLDAIIGATEFLSNAPDHAARIFSEAYRAQLPPEVRDDPDNRSARPWDALDETFRQATRDAVAHIPAKMASAGIERRLWVGVGGPPRLPPGVRLFNTDAECEHLAELEHERWNAQRRMEGWRWADIRGKDDARRRHSDLVPFDRLPEATKAYDRTIVRETQLVCSRPDDGSE